MIGYCPVCEKEHEIMLRKKDVSLDVSGTRISVSGEFCFCPFTDKEYQNGKQLNEFMAKARALKAECEKRQKENCPMRAEAVCLPFKSICADVDSITCMSLWNAYQFGKKEISSQIQDIIEGMQNKNGKEN